MSQSALEALRGKLLSADASSPLLDLIPHAEHAITIYPETADDVYARLLRGALAPMPKATPCASDQVRTIHDALDLRERASALCEEEDTPVHLAMGLLQYQTRDGKTASAPLIWIPLRLREGGTFAIAGRPRGNATLLEHMRTKYTVLLPMPNNPLDSPAAYADAVAACVQPYGWRVFSDALMILRADLPNQDLLDALDPAAWQNAPGMGFLHCLMNGRFPELPAFAPLDFQIYDLDSLQAQAMSAAQGGILALDGAGGTGKTQWAANLLGYVVYHGGTALCLVDAPGTADAMVNRLRQAGLEGLCLDLNALCKNPKALLPTILRRLQPEPLTPPPEYDGLKHQAAYEALDAYACALATPAASSPYTLSQLYAWELDVKAITQPPRELPNLMGMDVQGLEWCLRCACQLRDAGIQHPTSNPFFASRRTSVTAEEMQSFAAMLYDAQNAMQRIMGVSSALAAAMQVPAPANLQSLRVLSKRAQLLSEIPDFSGIPLYDAGWKQPQDVRKVLRTANRIAKDYQKRQKPYAQYFKPEAWSTDVQPLYQAAVALSQNAPAPISLRALKSKHGQLMQKGQARTLEEILDSLGALTACQELERAFAEPGAYLAQLYGPYFTGMNSRWLELDAKAAWLFEASKLDENQPGYLPDTACESVRELSGAAQSALADANAMLLALSGFLQIDWVEALGAQMETAPFDELVSKLYEWAQEMDRLPAQLTLNALVAPLEAQGCAELTMEAIRTGRLDQLPEWIQLAWIRAAIEATHAQDPEMFQRTADEWEVLHQQYVKQDEALQAVLRHAIRQNHQMRIAAVHKDERLIAWQRENTTPTKAFFFSMADILQYVFPIIIATPENVLDWFPGGTFAFDWLVCEGGESISMPEAVPALLRCSRAVVTGNRAIGKPGNLMMSFVQAGAAWHVLNRPYRASHPSLAEAADRLFPDHRSAWFSATERKPDATGLTMQLVAAGEEGVEQVATAALRHAQRTPKLSLLVVTLNEGARREVDGAIERIRAQLQTQGASADVRALPDVISIRQIGNARRDIVILYVDAVVSEPRLRERLARLVCAPRVRLSLFTAVSPTELANDGSPLSELLRAAAQPREIPARLPDGSLLDYVEKTLAGRYPVVRLEGGMGVDLAVVNPNKPNRFLLGLMAEGTAQIGVRERERLRLTIARRKGWVIERLHSGDWYRDPRKEMERLVHKIDAMLGKAQVMKAPEKRVAAAKPETGALPPWLSAAGAEGESAGAANVDMPPWLRA